MLKKTLIIGAIVILFPFYTVTGLNQSITISEEKIFIKQIKIKILYL